MKTKLHVRALSALVLASLALTGCGGGGPFRLVFPRIFVEVDKEGFPTVAGINPGMLRFFGVDPNQFKLDPATVSKLTDSNLQHVELLFRNDGLYWWANGKALVPLTWDDASFDNTKDLVTRFVKLDEATSGVLNNVLLPAARSMEQNVIIRFPIKDGQAEIPLREMGGPLPEPGAAVDPSLIGGLRLTFDDAGIPSIAGVSFSEIEKLAGADLSSAKLPPDTVQQMKDAGIQHVTIRTTPEGIKVWSNDKPLPTLRWSEETLTNTADTLASLELIEPALGTVIKQFLPYLNRADVDLVLKFPTGGAAPIPEPAR
ncbi:MAG: hypothetical protein RMN52_08015 [Anaerolineae bacterium]|nr:hypothetical protein [Candidatus Roseilinea sp.]MDW8449934.1 hypothetical protein [Anaerolineae bacterium]